MSNKKNMIATFVLSAFLIGGLFFGLAEGRGLQIGRQRENKPRPQAQKLSQSPDRPQDATEPWAGQPSQRSDEGSPMDPLRNRRIVMQALNLTREQQRQARQLYQRLGPKLQQLRDELEERHDALNQAIAGESSDSKAIEQRIQAILQKQEEVLRAQAEMELAFREILTPEQLAKFKEMQARQIEIRRLERQVRQQRRLLMEELRIPPPQ
jgi:Spy/CpxP family protein refolding chaperone